MLKLSNIKKDYKVADGLVHALRGISINFRKSEFVSILGPSGCGKTTLLNLIGGLDRPTDGDMLINGISTKNFNNRDYDIYRNHSVGFVFQTYNLIPHQTVLSNVELALTIAGLSKEERVKRAKKALDEVGLSDKYYKKPNQLSGGQSQRVAIARALVNDPEILLADEPTGALDTKTSKQIMELIKEISKDRLVIMVTHNPELAEEYSTRIVTMLDGELQSDSNPYEGSSKEKNNKAVEKQNKKNYTAKMTWWTTFKLSLNNLFSKKSRTFLTAIASSIGIIGISLVLALSNGLQSYIDNVQEDMLSGNPITITENAIDLEAFADTAQLNNQVEIIKEAGFLNINKLVDEIARRASSSMDSMITNNITEAYINYVSQIPKEHASEVFLDYEINISNNLYVDFYENDEDEGTNISISVLRNIITSILKDGEQTAPYADMISLFIQDFRQAPSNEEYILEQYDLLEGRYATGKNEIMVVANKDSLINDLLLAQLGYFSQEEFINVILKATGDDRYDPSIEVRTKISYEEIMNKTFTWYPNDIVFNKETGSNSGINPFTYNPYSSDFTVEDPNGVELTIVGILEPKEQISFGSLQSGFYYTEELTNHILDVNMESEIANYIRSTERGSITSMLQTQTTGPGGVELPEPIEIPIGLAYTYDYTYFGEVKTDNIGFVGNTNPIANIFADFMPGGGSSDEAVDFYTLTLRDVGGVDIASSISVYPKNLDTKVYVLEYLDRWNSDEDIVLDGVTLMPRDRDEIRYTDALTIIFNLINGILNAVTIALIGFTALALLVSSVMIAVITYVSVVERTNEIGVIRSLGGRKKDVSNLFIAETAIIGLSAGLIAIGFTYFVSIIINIIVKPLVGSNLAVLPWNYAVTMILISITLTLISGLIPSRSAAKKDPVDALRTE